MLLNLIALGSFFFGTAASAQGALGPRNTGNHYAVLSLSQASLVQFANFAPEAPCSFLQLRYRSPFHGIKLVYWAIVLFSFRGAETEAAKKRPRPSSAVFLPMPGAFAGSFTGSAVLPGAAAGSFTGSTVFPGVAAGPFTGPAVLPGAFAGSYMCSAVSPDATAGSSTGSAKKKPRKERPKGELKPIEFPSPTAGSKNMRSANVEHTPSEFEALAEGKARRKSNARRLARE